MKDLLQKLSHEYRKSSILNKIIYINIGVFLFISIFESFAFITQINIQHYLEKLFLPADTNKVISRPWTFLSYMFLHNNIFHLLFNMMWLYFAGNIFLLKLTQKKLLESYILGGICGGLLFIISYNYIPALSVYKIDAKALGSSAGVLAIVIASATSSPNYNIRLPLIGLVKLKTIAIICVLIDIISIPKGNAGGHIAHLGGALFGYLYVKQLKYKKTSNIISELFCSITQMFSKKKTLSKIHKRPKSDYSFNKEKYEKEKNIDIIFEKISKSGYESLNKDEKEKLFKSSKK